MSESRVDAGTESVHRIEFEMKWPPGHVAAYLLEADEPILVDAGMPSDDDGADHDATLTEGLAAHGYEVADIEHLVITHPHVDHVGQVPRILAAADPAVYAPAGVEERFGRDPTALGERVRRNAAMAGIQGEQLEEAVEMAVESLERDSALLPLDAVDQWVAGGETVTVAGLDLTAIHTPGHQADHLCYETTIDDERALLAGDMAIRPFRPVAMHDGMDDGVIDAISAFYRALDRLDDLDPDRVYPDHGPIHDELHETIERDRGSLDHRLDGVREAVGDGLRTVPGIAMEIAGERGVRYMIAEAMAALAYLEADGRVVGTVEDGVRYYDIP
jgi:glyoxylase-like metal-dependent hydrolase (beta-lactamase superfamily II)